MDMFDVAVQSSNPTPFSIFMSIVAVMIVGALIWFGFVLFRKDLGVEYTVVLICLYGIISFCLGYLFWFFVSDTPLGSSSAALSRKVDIAVQENLDEALSSKFVDFKLDGSVGEYVVEGPDAFMKFSDSYLKNSIGGFKVRSDSSMLFPFAARDNSGTTVEGFLDVHGLDLKSLNPESFFGDRKVSFSAAIFVRQVSGEFVKLSEFIGSDR